MASTALVAAPLSDEEKAVAKAQDDEKTAKFVNALTGITMGVKGILRSHTRKHGRCKGVVKTPFRHQRTLVKRMIGVKTGRMVINHAAGLGKTYSFLLYVAARYTLTKGNMPKVLITAPTSCLNQWYDAVLDTLRVSPDSVLMTTKRKDMTKDMIDSHDIIIISRDMVGNAARSCYVWVTAHHQHEHNNCWVSAWDRREGTELHPLFDTRFDIVAFDEVHALRNALTGWTYGHSVIAKNADFVAGISATLIFNRPDDLRGIAVGMSMAPHFQDKAWWYEDRKCQKIKVDAIKEFASNVDSVGEDVLDLPPITHVTKSFPAGVQTSQVDGYNAILGQAKRLRVWMQRDGRGNQQAHLALLGHLQRLQQYLVSPIIADNGATDLQRDKDLVSQAALEHTGALSALKNEIEELNASGYARVMVACSHTSLMAVAKAYLERESPGCGTLLSYDGTLTKTRRVTVPDQFLSAANAVLFLSIDAGGTGLHLCPGCEAAIFWGSRPFSPMSVLQASKRIHRIGQTKPVKIVHLIAEGSVDFAINRVHKDKQELADAIYDTGALEAKQGRWRTTGRIVDSCAFLNDTGQFEPSISENDIERRLAPPEAPQTAPPQGQPLAWAPQFMPGTAGIAGAILAQAAQAAANVIGL